MGSSAVLDLARPAVLQETERKDALEASRVVAKLTGRGAVRVDAVPIRDNEQSQTFILPAPAVQLLTEMLVHLGAGIPVTVIPDHAELTTQQAADFLNVSRPWIIKLIERNELPHRMVGTAPSCLVLGLAHLQSTLERDPSQCARQAGG